MQLSPRVAMRYLARSLPKTEYFDEEVGYAAATLADVWSYLKTMSEARDILRSVTQCLRSKALGKVYVRLDEALGKLPMATKELEVMIEEMLRLDRIVVAEEKRLTDIIRAAPEDQEFDEKDVRLPEAEIVKLGQRIERYDKFIAATLDDSFSIDELGNAGSLDLKTYERLNEKCISWEELVFPEVHMTSKTYITHLADAVIQRALDAAAD